MRHEKKFPHVCSICNKGFVCNATFIEHIESHRGIKRFQCEICDKKFLFRRYLLDHVKNNHNSIEMYCCEICDRNFSFKYSLRRHLNVVHGFGKKRAINCSICNKILANSYNLKMHLMVHTGEKPFVCEICGITFSRNMFLNKHFLLKHTC